MDCVKSVLIIIFQMLVDLNVRGHVRRSNVIKIKSLLQMAGVLDVVQKKEYQGMDFNALNYPDVEQGNTVITCIQISNVKLVLIIKD